MRIGGKLTENPAARILLKFLFGGVGYGLIEIIWRGYTHPSMVLTGGLCFAMICAMNGRLAHHSLLFRSAACTVGVTFVEFCVGMVVNQMFDMSVWDYSDEWLHLFGQICPLYSLLWFGLCLTVCFVISRMKLSAISSNFKK